VTSCAPYKSGVDQTAAQNYFNDQMLNRIKDLEYFIWFHDAKYDPNNQNVENWPTVPFILTIFCTIDCLGGIVCGFRENRLQNGQCKVRGNSVPRFTHVCQNLMGCTEAEANFLYRAARNGFVHGGFGEMLAVVDPVNELQDNGRFLAHHENDGKILVYLKDLARRVIRAIEHVRDNGPDFASSTSLS
jgi:hypothetical protein